jgi:N-acetylmuramic acid 6-phosphate etherase
VRREPAGSDAWPGTPDPRDLDLLDTPALLRRIHAGDEASVAAVGQALSEIAAVVDAIAERLRRGGRLKAVGAGTSGRLLALDAAELWPTFGFPPQRWEVAMAGGPEAFWRAQEGAEDDREAGARAVADVEPGDVVLGVSASGRTPFVGGALEAARRRGVLTTGIFCVRPATLEAVTDLAVHLVTGPEVLQGSTRMKAGTAQKMALTAISTAVMVRLHRVYRDYMIDMQVTNQKLEARAVAFVSEITGQAPEDARRLLAETGWSVRRAVAARWTGLRGAELEAWTAQHPDLRAAEVSDRGLPPA